MQFFWIPPVWWIPPSSRWSLIIIISTHQMQRLIQEKGKSSIRLILGKQVIHSLLDHHLNISFDQFMWPLFHVGSLSTDDTSSALSGHSWRILYKVNWCCHFSFLVCKRQKLKKILLVPGSGLYYLLKLLLERIMTSGSFFCPFFAKKRIFYP